MRCDICDQLAADTAIKMFRGKEVCADCFQTLVSAAAAPERSQPQLVQTKFVVTTVCPDCNTELHADTKYCPECGALVSRVDRNWRFAFRILYIVLALFGLMMLIGSIGVSVERSDPMNLFIGLPLAALSIGGAIWGYRHTLTKRPARRDDSE